MDVLLFKQSVRGTGHAMSVARQLVRDSVWFEVEPWPNDEWYFTVKDEAARLLEEAIKIQAR